MLEGLNQKSVECRNMLHQKVFSFLDPVLFREALAVNQANQDPYLGTLHCIVYKYWCYMARFGDWNQSRKQKAICPLACNLFLHLLLIPGSCFLLYPSNSPLIYNFSRLCPSLSSLVVALFRAVILPSWVRINTQSGRIILLVIKLVLCVVKIT